MYDNILIPVLVSKHIAGTNVVHFCEPEGPKCGLPKSEPLFFVLNLLRLRRMLMQTTILQMENQREREIRNLKEKVFQTTAGGTQTSRQLDAFLLI